MLNLLVHDVTSRLKKVMKNYDLHYRLQDDAKFHIPALHKVVNKIMNSALMVIITITIHDLHSSCTQYEFAGRTISYSTQYDVLKQAERAITNIGRGDKFRLQ
jgi:oligoribonuclease NrnB/cAMP/cGMP phosphodiesterase (DHH superfamily)